MPTKTNDIPNFRKFFLDNYGNDFITLKQQGEEKRYYKVATRNAAFVAYTQQYQLPFRVHKEVLSLTPSYIAISASVVEITEHGAVVHYTAFAQADQNEFKNSKQKYRLLQICDTAALGRAISGWGGLYDDLDDDEDDFLADAPYDVPKNNKPQEKEAVDDATKAKRMRAAFKGKTGLEIPETYTTEKDIRSYVASGILSVSKVVTPSQLSRYAAELGVESIIDTTKFSDQLMLYTDLLDWILLVQEGFGDLVLSSYNKDGSTLLLSDGRFEFEIDYIGCDDQETIKWFDGLRDTGGEWFDINKDEPPFPVIVNKQNKLELG